MEQTRESVLGLIGGFPFFDDFDKTELERFAHNLSLQHLKAGSVLFKEGDIGDYLFFVVDGVIEVSIEGRKKQEKVVASYSSGASVGEMALIDEYERSATVRAGTDCEILLLTKSRFDKILVEHADIGVKLLKGLAKNISMRLRARDDEMREIEL